MVLERVIIHMVAWGLMGAMDLMGVDYMETTCIEEAMVDFMEVACTVGECIIVLEGPWVVMEGWVWEALTVNRIQIIHLVDPLLHQAFGFR